MSKSNPTFDELVEQAREEERRAPQEARRRLNRTRVKVALVVLCMCSFLVGLASLSIFACGQAIDKMFNPDPIGYLAQSSVQTGRVVFIDLQDWRWGAKDVLVFDDAQKRNRPAFKHAYATDMERMIEQAVWSRDGSVLAIRAHLRWKVAHDVGFYDAYDFREHRVFTLPTNTGNIQKAHRLSAEIKTLLQQRGGEGERAFPPIEKPTRPQTELTIDECKKYERMVWE